MSLFDESEKAMTTELATREVSPMVLLQDAVKAGMSPDQLAVLVGLQRDMADDAAKRAYAEAMSACQAEMPTVVADGYNPDTNRKFPKFETIQQVAKPIYSKHGFALTFTDAECSIQGWKRTACDCRHRAGHTTHHFIDMPVDGVTAKGNPISKMNPVQGCVSTNSYASRALTCNIFNITIAGKDKDGAGPTIGEDELATIHEWLSQLDPKELEPFLAYMKVDDLTKIPRRDFGKAINALKKVAAARGVKV